jgi:hypothetical protein
MSIEYENSNMPRQRLAYRKKTKTWRKEVIDAIDKRHTIHGIDDTVRNNTREKYINQQLYEGRVDKQDMVRYINPYDIKGLKIDGELPHHNIIVPKLNVLIGEEDKRQFDYTVVVTTPNAISEKVESKKKAIDERLTKIIEQEFMPQQQQIEQMKQQGMDTGQQEQQLKQAMDEAMKKITKYSKYNWKDQRELAANRILKHYGLEQSFDRIFNDGFKDALILGEEIYQVDILDNEPLLSKLNPLNVHTVKSGRSSRIEDADIIVIEDYWSPGKIIDHFYNELRPSEIDQISNEGAGIDNGTQGIRDMDREFTRPVVIGATGQDDSMLDVDTLLSAAEIDGYETPYAIYDGDGNVRVLRVYWRSQKKIIKVKYYDEDGSTQYKIMAEEYKIDPNSGEEGETLWINEWWEGTKIARDIYINMRPRRIQYNKLESPSRGGPGIIGELYNTNQGRVVSMVSRMKSYQYLYDSVWDRLMKAIAKNMGKILEVDVAKIPANWDVGQWFHYATTMGIGFVDSFKEGNKGASTGKLAGGFNTTGKVLDVETGNYIQAQIQLLEYVKQEMADLVGISKQREGQVSNRETVGGVERSVMQSSHITEWWFSKHDDVKVRVLQAFIDTAKVALKGSTKKVQYILDDMSVEAFILDGDDFAEVDYGVAVTSNAATRELKQRMDGLVQAGLQNQMLKFSDLLYIYSSNSLADIRRKIEGTEEEKAQEAAKAQEVQQQQMQQAQAQAQQLAEQEQARLDQELELKGADIANDRYKIETDLRVKLMELGMTGQMNDQDTDEEKPLDRDKHEETVRHNKATEQIARSKPKPTTSK